MPETVSQIHRSLPGAHDIHRHVLSNGIIVLLRANRNSASIAMAGSLAAGSHADPLEKLGLADFCAQALKYGTQRYSFDSLYDLLESCGANIGFSASTHNTGFSARCLSEDLPLLLDILRETLSQPTFPEEPVNRLKGQLLTSLQIMAQDTRSIAARNFDRMLYGDHVYALPTEGEIETLRAISPADLRAFHALHYGPRGMIITLAGDIDEEQVLAQLEGSLGDWQNPLQPEDPRISPPLGTQSRLREHAVIPGKYQTDLVMGTLGPARLSSDYLSAAVGNNILGQFGLMGRIGDVVRDQAGLAYHASTSLNASLLCGSWEVVAGVNPANLERAIALIEQELKRFCAQPVEAEELSDSKANVIGSLPISMESNAGVAYLLLRMERFSLGLNYLHDFVHLVRQLSADDLLQAARHYLQLDKLVISSAGPARADGEAG